MRRTASLPRALAALLLLGVLAAGSASHYWHHFSDPHCGATETRAAQPCAACSALHGASISCDHEVAPLPDFNPAAESAPTPVAAPHAAPSRAVAPRGPPQA
jgi:hypothetical protein